MCPATFERVSRFVLFSVLVCSASACEPTTSLDPTTVNNKTVPNSVSYTVSASNLSATVVSWSEIDISWASNPSASGYQIFRSTSGSTGSYSLIATAGATERSYANTGLTGSTSYCYQVRSFKNAGKNTNYSAYAGPVCATTLGPPVLAPSETDAVPAGSGVRVQWKDNSSNEDGFRIERASAVAGPWEPAGTAAANATSAYASAPLEQTACFRVIAFNSVASSTPSTPDCTALPAAPTNLIAKALDGQSITLTWADNSVVEDGYLITRIESGGVETNLTTLPANTVTYRDANVRPDIEYTYRVLATRDGGLSSGSSYAIGFVPTTPPNTPSFFQVTYYVDPDGFGWNYLVFYWDDASSNEEGFRVEYSADGLGGWGLYLTTDADVNYTQTQTSVFDPPPPGGCWRVIAFNVVGASSPSVTACAEPGMAPGDLTATAVDQQAIDLTWTDNANIEKGYVVIRSTAIDGEYSVVANLGANATSYHDTGLASGQEYWYLVAAVYPGDNWGDYSNYASATTAIGTAGITSSRTVVVPRTGRARPVRVSGRPMLPPVRFLKKK